MPYETLMMKWISFIMKKSALFVSVHPGSRTAGQTICRFMDVHIKILFFNNKAQWNKMLRLMSICAKRIFLNQINFKLTGRNTESVNHP